MGFFDRWADARERQKVDTCVRAIARGLHEQYGNRDLKPEDTRAYILTRPGWTPALWEATVSALKMIQFEEKYDAAWWSKADMVGIAYVDAGFASQGTGKKLNASPQSAILQHLDEVIASGLVAFHNRNGLKARLCLPDGRG